MKLSSIEREISKRLRVINRLNAEIETIGRTANPHCPVKPGEIWQLKDGGQVSVVCTWSVGGDRLEKPVRFMVKFVRLSRVLRVPSKVVETWGAWILLEGKKLR